ncbi:hypothetical protein WJ968_23605 [Achromobacter xylosoxidans]
MLSSSMSVPTCDHAVIAAHRLDEAHAQLARRGVHIDRRDGRPVGLGGLLVPGARRAVEAIRHGVVEDVALVGVDDIGVIEAAGLLRGRGHGVRDGFGLVDGVLQRAGDALLVAHPGGQFIGVIARDLADIVVDLIEGIVAGH